MILQRYIYYKWLVERIHADENDAHGYAYLITTLFEQPFYVVLEKDLSRAADGVYLRRMYEEETEMELPDLGDCTVLEMLIALAERIDSAAMYSVKYGHRNSEWFWMMLRNLGLMQYDDTHFDERAVIKVLHKFMDRDYLPNGKGGLFPLKDDEKCHKDQREVEIWFQMSAYMLQKFGV